MSRMGRIPVEIPSGVTVQVGDGVISVAGPKGTLTQPHRQCVEFSLQDGKVTLTRKGNDKLTKALHGTYRALLSNMIEGVTKGFEKVLEIHGVGYRARVEGGKLILQVGKSHEPAFAIPKGVTAEVDKGTLVKISGTDKHLVGQWAATVRSAYPPEPYLGKGVRYQGEHVRRKAGKKMVG